jgi:hypothetical protein
MTASFLREGERIERPHVLVRRHSHRFVFCAPHAHFEIFENDEPSGWAQLRQTPLKQCGSMTGPETRARFEDRCSVGFFCPCARDRRAARRDFGEGAYLFAFDDHVLVVGGQAASLEPGLTPQLGEQGRELAEMGRALDRPRFEAEFFGHGIVVDRGVAAIFLRGQHLARPAQRTADGQRRVENHARKLPIDRAVIRHNAHASAKAFLIAVVSCRTLTSARRECRRRGLRGRSLRPD